jgi:hypothetical protein
LSVILQEEPTFGHHGIAESNHIDPPLCKHTALSSILHVHKKANKENHLANKNANNDSESDKAFITYLTFHLQIRWQVEHPAA